MFVCLAIVKACAKLYNNHLICQGAEPTNPAVSAVFLLLTGTS